MRRGPPSTRCGPAATPSSSGPGPRRATTRRARGATPTGGRRPVGTAVVVGAGPALADDPQLRVRTADGRTAERQPLRVVADRRGLLPATARVLDDAAPTYVSRAATPAGLLGELFDRDVRR